MLAWTSPPRHQQHALGSMYQHASSGRRSPSSWRSKTASLVPFYPICRLATDAHSPYTISNAWLSPHFGFSSYLLDYTQSAHCHCLSPSGASCYLVSTHFNTWERGSITTALKHRRISDICFFWSTPPPNSARQAVHQSASLTTIHLYNDAAKQLQQHILPVLDFTRLVK